DRAHEGLALALERVVHVRRDSAEGGRAAAALVVVRGAHLAELRVEVRVHVDRARHDDAAARVDLLLAVDLLGDHADASALDADLGLVHGLDRRDPAAADHRLDGHLVRNRPALEPVGRPSRTPNSPLTRTWRTPSGGRSESSYVAESSISPASNTTTSA